MFDARYFAYATISALLVISPGATMAVVLEAAVEGGWKRAFSTVVGVNIGNSTLALSSALGMAVVFARWPWTLEVVKVGGAIYLTWLGARGIWRAVAAERGAPATLTAHATPVPGAGASLASFVGRGVMTNLLNPPVILFYMTFLPQFISAGDPFFTRFLVLAVTHVSMSLVWLSIYALSIGTLSERMARPLVRRWMTAITGAVLIGFGVRLFLR
ncbi:MAG: LysE family translocator [Planctomycetes bacterium]|nr:LysE family translocator [Planctomycetota bacterium]